MPILEPGETLPAGLIDDAKNLCSWKIFNQGIKALHCLKYTRRRIWGLSAAIAFQHRARSTGQWWKLESICCCKGVCKGGNCKNPRGKLSTVSDVIATAGVKLVMNWTIHCAGLWTFSKTWHCRKHMEFAQEISPVQIQRTMLTSPSNWRHRLGTSHSRCFMSSCDYHQSLSHSSFILRLENAWASTAEVKSATFFCLDMLLAAASSSNRT